MEVCVSPPSFALSSTTSKTDRDGNGVVIHVGPSVPWLLHPLISRKKTAFAALRSVQCLRKKFATQNVGETLCDEQPILGPWYKILGTKSSVVVAVFLFFFFFLGKTATTTLDFVSIC